jgi:hypothetical protein
MNLDTFVAELHVAAHLSSADERLSAIQALYERTRRETAEECAAICDDRAMECEIKTESESDEDEITELRSLAWQFAVLASRIRETISGG